MSKPFHDVVERPHFELGGRFKNEPGAKPGAIRQFTREELDAINAAAGAPTHPAVSVSIPHTAPGIAEDPLAGLAPEDRMQEIPDEPVAEERNKPLHGTAANRAVAAKAASKPGRKPTVQVDHSEVARLRAKGMGNGTIAKQLGSNKSTIQRIAAKINAPVAPDAGMNETALKVIESVLQTQGPYASDDNAEWERMFEIQESLSYDLCAEREASQQADAAIKELDRDVDGMRKAVHARLLALYKAKRRLEFELIDVVKDYRRNKDPKAERIEVLLPDADRERICASTRSDKGK